MGALAAGLGLSAVGAGLDVIGQQRQANADADAAAEAYNDWLLSQDMRQGQAQELSGLFDLTQKNFTGGVYTDPVTGQQSPIYVNGESPLGTAVAGLGTAADQAKALQTTGLESGLSALYQTPGAVSGALNQYGQAAQGLTGSYLGQAGQALSPALGMTQYAEKAAAGPNVYDLPGAYDKRMQDWQQDPGYQFRQKQGEDAIMRAASASGGRLSGSTLQSLVDYNQNLASQEYANVAGRSQGLLGQQAGAVNQAGLSTQGVQAGLGQAGLQAGSQLAGLYGGAGSQLSNLYGGYGSQLGGQIGSVGTNAAQMTAQGYSGLADLENQAAQNQYNTRMGLQTAKYNARSQGLMGAPPTPMPQTNVGGAYSSAGAGLSR